MLGEAVTIFTPGAPSGEDDEGNPIPGPDVATSVSDVYVAVSQRSEDVDVDGEVAVTGLTLYMPSGTVVPRTARVEVRGDGDWYVDGEAFEWLSPHLPRARDGVVVNVKRRS